MHTILAATASGSPPTWSCSSRLAKGLVWLALTIGTIALFYALRIIFYVGRIDATMGQFGTGDPTSYSLTDIFLIHGRCWWAMLAISVGFFVFRRDKTGGWIWVACLLEIIASGHAYSLLPVALVALASYGLGDWLAAKFQPRSMGSVADFALRLFLGGSLNGYFVWLMSHLAVNFYLTHLIFYAVQAWLFRARTGSMLRKAWASRLTLSLTAGQWLALAFVLYYLPYQLVPFYNWDELVTHLSIPKMIALNHKFLFDPGFVPAFYHSIVPWSTFTSLYLLDGEFAARLTNHSLMLVSLLLVESFARRRFGARSAAIAIAAIITVPFVGLIAAKVFLDPFHFLSAFLLVVVFFEKPVADSSRQFTLCCLVSILAYLNKQQACVVAMPIILFLAAREIWSARELGIGKIWRLVPGTAIFFGLLAPVLFQNYYYTRNPFFPFMNLVFKSPYWSVDPSYLYNRVYVKALLRLDFLRDITFNGHKTYFSSSGNFGFGLFPWVCLIAVVGLGARLVRDRFIGGLVALVLASTYLVFKIPGPEMRYFLVPYCLAAVLTGEAVVWAACRFRPGHLSARVTFAWGSLLLGGTLFTNLMLATVTPSIADPYPLAEAITHDYAGSNIATCRGNEEMQKVFTFAELKYGRGAKGVLHYSPDLYHPNFKVVQYDWHFYTFVQEVDQGTNDAKILADYDFFILDDGSSFINRFHLKKEFGAGGFGVYPTPKHWHDGP